ncbi:hypothetical protein [uncultured Methanospirillum sp.]|uniref:hypothetical protein n=1 Tax=uncultured Methanospirillum sp. TaxID=262503 RepID=UPI0029C83D8E|nr:hypothetical protein [uncultured Methanospirillum sp.]
MKLERNSIIAIVFGITLAILLLFNLVTSGFKLDLKGVLVSIYFAVWAGAVTFVLFTFILPFIKTRKEEGKKAKGGTKPGATPVPFKSPRSGLPVRERITAYVTERRREDGLPAPEPLRPARPASGTVVTAAAAGAAAAGMAVSAAASAPEVSGSDSGEMGDLPLPDDFGSVESEGDAGELPGLDDDLGGFDDFEGGDEFGGGDEMPPDFGDDNSGLLGDDGGAAMAAPSEPAEAPAESLSDGGLPGFDGDLDSDIGESDIMGDDSMMDLSGDDLLVMDEEPSSAPAEESGGSDGGLSEAGLPDLDESLSLEPDMMDNDLSGGDEDFGDIEFMDLEPEEPKKPSKK